MEINYQKQGIGTNLIRVVVDTIGQKFHVSSKGIKGQTSFYLTTTGVALIKSCLSKMIILNEQCMMDVPPMTPVNSPNSHYGA